jgi:hypothetical protein
VSWGYLLKAAVTAGFAALFVWFANANRKPRWLGNLFFWLALASLVLWLVTESDFIRKQPFMFPE